MPAAAAQPSCLHPTLAAVSPSSHPAHAACLRDLQRFLRRDDPRDRPAFMKLGELQVVQNDVISLITGNPTDTDLVYNARE
jgi:hypothetical protein